MTRATGITFTLTLLLGCGPGGGPHSAVAPDPLSASNRDRHASQDACPEHGEISFTRFANDRSELTLALHCGGWLDRCDEYFDKVDDPEGPHLEVVEGYPGYGAEDDLHGEFHPIEAARARAVWRVARADSWRSWESCADDEDADPRWYVSVDDGDMGIVSVSCNGQLPPAWRATYDSLDALYRNGAIQAPAGEPPSTADSEDTHTVPEAKLAELDANIDRLNKLAVRYYSDDPERPRVMMELAIAYRDKRDYYDSRIASLTAEIAAAHEAGDEQAAARHELQRDEYDKLSRASSIRSIVVLHALTDDRDYRGYEHRDDALVLLTDVPGAAARSACLRLLREYPDDERGGPVCLELADHYFDEGHFRFAVNLYEEIVNHKDQSLHAHALYRLACSHTHPLDKGEAARYDESLRYFVKAIEATKEQGRARSDEEARELRRLSRLGLVEPYSHVAGPSQAWSLFERVGAGPGQDEDETRQMMELLAEAYAKIDKRDESAAVYESLRDRFRAD